MIVLRIQAGELRNALKDLIKLAEKPRRILAAAAGSLQDCLQQHFKSRAGEGNKLGGKSTGFWSKISDSVVVPDALQTDRQATVVIGAPEFAQKYFGGQIVAKNVPWLTIPMHPDAHGRRASVLEQELGVKLFVVTLKRDFRSFLGAKVDGELTLFYRLKTEVNQLPDPRALPEPSVMDRAVSEGAEIQFREEILQIQRN